MALLAQHGYGKSNKIQRGIENDDIAGVIISPKSEKPEKVAQFINELGHLHPQSIVLFDPQFFLGGLGRTVNEGKIIQYPYYEKDLTRIKLSNPRNLSRYAQTVIEFQNGMGFSYVLSPSIIVSSFDAIDCQHAISLAYSSIDYMAEDSEKLYISLYVHENAFANKQSMEEFLDLVSTFDVRGFYLVVCKENNTVKTTLFNSEILANIMKFIYVLSEINQYDIIMGYSDMISVLYTTISNATFACGWYANLKQFSESNFLISTGGRRPRKRYTSTKLFGSLLLVPELQALNTNNFTNNILSNSPYDEIVFPTIHTDDWTDEISCLHNWKSLNSIINEINSAGQFSNRLNLLSEKIADAERLYAQINTILPQLDSKSNGNHLDSWKEAISIFRNEMGV